VSKPTPAESGHPSNFVGRSSTARYRLASSVSAGDQSRAAPMAIALDFGGVWINTHIPIVAQMPHGGFKQSGYGQDLSSYGLEEYARIKHVMSYIGS
jgi:betaine-aldehyde dehydrogenase